MNKKEAIALGLFLVSFFIITIVLFSGINKEVSIKLENDKIIKTAIPANFPVGITVFLMFLSDLV